MDTDKVLSANLARRATVPVDALGDHRGAAHLERELGIVIPDATVGRFATVRDVQSCLDQHTRTRNGKVTTS
ncbi:hypothetical protein [Streptacidiphilus sp. MAP12-20]|uniref:hypothetical protein n=1 Tax=Streptacidiphilus sp. MAP12-20 TaxID=3156299 RepID=UPI0035178D17